MVDSPQVRRIALALPGVVDDSTRDRLVFSCGTRGIAWTFMQRDAPKKPRWPNIEVLAISCTPDHKEMLIEAAPDIFFDDDHYRGYPAVLVRLPDIDEAELAGLLQNACVLQAGKPKRKTR